MSRFSRYDTDEERLPHGMTRVGYDDDTQVYTFKDNDGSYWESAPGSQYGQLTQISSSSNANAASDTEPFLITEDSTQRTSWRHDLMPLLNFGVIIGVSFLLLLWYLHRAASNDSPASVACSEGGAPYSIQPGDTCWGLTERYHVTLEEITYLNGGLDCDRLLIGSMICLPDF